MWRAEYDNLTARLLFSVLTAYREKMLCLLPTAAAQPLNNAGQVKDRPEIDEPIEDQGHTNKDRQRQTAERVYYQNDADRDGEDSQNQIYPPILIAHTLEINQCLNLKNTLYNDENTQKQREKREHLARTK